MEYKSDKDVEKGIRNASEETLQKESVRVKSQRTRNATGGRVVRKESVEIKIHRIRDATDEKAVRKKLVEVKKQRIINAAVDEQVLGKRTKYIQESRLQNNKTQDEIQQQNVEERKVDFEVDSAVKNETERERQKSPEKSQAFSLRINKVIKIKDEPLSGKVTKTIHLKEDLWE